MLILGVFFFFSTGNEFLPPHQHQHLSWLYFSYSILLYSILQLSMRRGLKIYASVSAVLVYLGSCSTINRAYFSISSRCTIHFPIAVPFLVVSVSYTCSSHTQFELHYAGGFFSAFLEVKKKKIQTSFDDFSLFLCLFVFTNNAIKLY